MECYIVESVLVDWTRILFGYAVSLPGSLSSTLPEHFLRVVACLDLPKEVSFPTSFYICHTSIKRKRVREVIF